MANGEKGKGRSQNQFQEEEYLPVVTVSKFTGMTQYGFSDARGFQTQMVQVQRRNNKNEVIILMLLRDSVG